MRGHDNIRYFLRILRKDGPAVHQEQLLSIKLSRIMGAHLILHFGKLDCGMDPTGESCVFYESPSVK